MKKLCIYYVGYIVVIMVLLGKHFLNITRMRGGRAVGIVVILLMSALLIYLTYDTIRKSNLERMKNSIPQKKSEFEMLRDNISTISHLAKARGNASKMIYDEIVQAEKVATDAFLSITSLKEVLENTFSRNDLTFTMYSDSVNQIIEAINANLAAIVKRVKVFKSSWTPENSVASTYKTEVQQYLTDTSEIRDKIDSLTLELVRVGDTDQGINDSELTELIRQTENYVKVRRIK